MKIKKLIFIIPYIAFCIGSGAPAIGSTTIGGGGGIDIGGGGIDIITSACSTITCSSGSTTTEIEVNKTEASCTSFGTVICYKNKNNNNSYRAKNCTACASGYKLATLNITECPQAAAGQYETYTGCVRDCQKGYYADPGITNCIRCPLSDGVYGTTTGTGAVSSAACYIPAGTTLSDSTGTYTYTSDCYYAR